MSETESRKTIFQELDELAALRKGEVSIAIGNVTLAWNALQESLGLLFSYVVNARSQTMALDIWHSHVSDRAQREMLRAALQEESAAIRSGVAEAIIWLLNEADDLSNRRNETIHTHFSIRMRGDDLLYEPDPGSRSKFAKRLAGKDAVAEFRVHSEWARRLSVYAIELRGYIPHPPFHHENGPLPDKPHRPKKEPSPSRKRRTPPASSAK